MTNTSYQERFRRIGSLGRIVTVPAVIALTALGSLTACSNSNESAPGETSDSSSATSSTGSKTREGNAAGADSAPGDENALDTGKIEVTAEPVENLSEGDTINVSITGLNADLGYYAAICAADDSDEATVPDCTGDRTTTNTQQWITKKSGGTVPMGENGSAKFSINAVPTSDSVDCTKQECVLKLFGDHSEGFEDVVDLPVSFAK